jgi:tetratricopeptide (TPR) repeat protein
VDGLVAPDAARRQEALRRVQDVDASWLPAVAERFERLADSANKPALKELLERLRERTRSERRRLFEAEGRSGAITTPDYLEMLVLQDDRSSPQLRALTEVVTCSRLFEKIGTLPAARRLVSVYVRFGEFLRVDTQLALARLGDRAVAALLEATGHPAPRIASWAERQLADLGKGRPSDALQLDDPALRADVLRAYGKLRPLEVMPLLVSYASSDTTLVRTAAREALSAYGEAAVWALREGYEKTLGERAPLAWSWERVARELFARFDQQRRGDVLGLYEQGRSAERNGDLLGACAAFDQVLAREPLFELGPSMAETYLRCASADTDAERALLAASRAERLEPQNPLHDRALSLRQTLQAEGLMQRGLIDRTLLERARQLDPHNQRAQALLAQVGSAARWHTGPWLRYLGAGAILLLGAIGVIWIAVRQRIQQS